MEYPKRISDNITFKEATKSRKAISLGLENLPDEKQLANMKAVAEYVFQPMREHFGLAIGISSFFRHPEVNKAVGGAKHSQHMRGCAIDIDADIYDKQFEDGCDLTNKMIFDYIADNLEYDTIIWEFGDNDNPGWVHVSFVQHNNRRRKLRAFRNSEGKAQYATY